MNSDIEEAGLVLTENRRQAEKFPLGSIAAELVARPRFADAKAPSGINASDEGHWNGPATSLMGRPATAGPEALEQIRTAVATAREFLCHRPILPADHGSAPSCVAACSRAAPNLNRHVRFDQQGWEKERCQWARFAHPRLYHPGRAERRRNVCSSRSGRRAHRGRATKQLT